MLREHPLRSRVKAQTRSIAQRLELSFPPRVDAGQTLVPARRVIAVNIIRRAEVGEVLARIYDAEISARVEWLFDGGFVWALIGAEDEIPRICIDDALADGFSTHLQSQEAAQALERGQFLQRDWRVRGRARTIEEAVTALAEAIARLHAGIPFAQWWTGRREGSSKREE